jgi:hypothetical protein
MACARSKNKAVNGYGSGARLPAGLRIGARTPSDAEASDSPTTAQSTLYRKTTVKRARDYPVSGRSATKSSCRRMKVSALDAEPIRTMLPATPDGLLLAESGTSVTGFA